MNIVGSDLLLCRLIGSHEWLRCLSLVVLVDVITAFNKTLPEEGGAECLPFIPIIYLHHLHL